MFDTRTPRTDSSRPVWSRGLGLTSLITAFAMAITMAFVSGGNAQGSASAATASKLTTVAHAPSAKVKSLIDAEDTPNLALRVAVRPGGCSGFSYEMYFDADQADDDVKSQHGGVTVVIDPASFQHLSGGSLDYKDGLQGAGFHITNPNAERTCGCGESFS